MRLEPDEPDVPVQAVVVGRGEARPPPHVRGLAGQVDLAPRRAVVGQRDDGLVPAFPDGAEGAVRVDYFKGVEARVHHLISGYQVGHDGPRQVGYEEQQHYVRHTPSHIPLFGSRCSS